MPRYPHGLAALHFLHCVALHTGASTVLARSGMVDSFALNEDGTACDPRGFQAALRTDSAKLALVMEEPEDRRSVLLGDDMAAFQSLLKAAVKVIHT